MRLCASLISDVDVSAWLILGYITEEVPIPDLETMRKRNKADLMVQLENPNNWAGMIDLIENQVLDVEVSDKVTVYQSTPGFEPQQNTVNTQKFFTLLIGVLVIGGFFQIQTLSGIFPFG